MTNFYVEQAKNTMRDFLVKEKTRAEEIKRNAGYYSVEMARTKNAEIINQSENDYLTTINAINDIFKIVKQKVALTSFPNSGDITEDIKLFDGAFPLSQKETEIFIDKYSTNETMLRIISKYLDDTYSDNPTTLAIMKAKIPSATNILDTYKRIFQNIINMIGTIHNNPSGSNKNAIDNFIPDLSVIGNGEFLKNYISNTDIVPDTYNDIFLIRQFNNTFEELR